MEKSATLAVAELESAVYHVGILRAPERYRNEVDRIFQRPLIERDANMRVAEKAYIQLQRVALGLGARGDKRNAYQWIGVKKPKAACQTIPCARRQSTSGPSCVGVGRGRCSPRDSPPPGWRRPTPL